MLCPSFYRTDTVHNPGRLDRMLDRFRRRAIAALQRRRETRRLAFADG